MTWQQCSNCRNVAEFVNLSPIIKKKRKTLYLPFPSFHPYASWIVMDWMWIVLVNGLGSGLVTCIRVDKQRQALYLPFRAFAL